MVPFLPDPLGLPQPRPSSRNPLFHAADRLRALTSWHGISRLIREPLWKVATASLLSAPLLAGIYQAAGGNPVVIEPSRLPPQSTALFVAGLAAALATGIYRLRCPAVIKEFVRASEYVGYRPHVVNSLRADVVLALRELMIHIPLTPEHAERERLRGRNREAELIDGLLFQGFKPIRYGYGCREMYAVQEFATRVGDAAGLPVRARFHASSDYRQVHPGLWCLPAQGADLYHLEVHLRGPSDDGDETDGIFLDGSVGGTDIQQDTRWVSLWERRKVAMLGVEHLVTPKTVPAVREGISEWLTLSRPVARELIVVLLLLASWQIAVVLANHVFLVGSVLRLN